MPSRPKATKAPRRPAARKGVPTIRDVLAAAYEGMGGLEALTQWGRDNPEKFYALWVKLQGAGEADKPVEVIHKIERIVVRPENPDG